MSRHLDLDPQPEHDWTPADERMGYSLTTLTLWAVVTFLVAAHTGDPVLTTIVAALVPLTVLSWHLGQTVERRRANRAMRESRALRNLEQRDHLGLLDWGTRVHVTDEQLGGPA